MISCECIIDQSMRRLRIPSTVCLRLANLQSVNVPTNPSLCVLTSLVETSFIFGQQGIMLTVLNDSFERRGESTDVRLSLTVDDVSENTEARTLLMNSTMKLLVVEECGTSCCGSDMLPHGLTCPWVLDLRMWFGSQPKRSFGVKSDTSWWGLKGKDRNQMGSRRQAWYPFQPVNARTLLSRIEIRDRCWRVLKRDANWDSAYNWYATLLERRSKSNVTYERWERVGQHSMIAVGLHQTFELD